MLYNGLRLRRRGTLGKGNDHATVLRNTSFRAVRFVVLVVVHGYLHLLPREAPLQDRLKTGRLAGNRARPHHIEEMRERKTPVRHTART